MSNMRKISDINGYVEGNSKWPDFDKKILGIHSLTFNSNILVNDFVRKEKID